MAETGASSRNYVIHSIIGILIMFSGYFLPGPSLIVEPAAKYAALNLPTVDGGLLLSITRMGMIASMIFFGMVYLWTAVDLVWPSLFGVCMIIFAGFMKAPQVLNGYVGNPTVSNAFFVFMIASAIVYCGLAQWIVRFLLTREFVKGKPWRLTVVFMFITYFVAIFGQIAACLLMWAVLFEVFKAVGFKKGDNYVKCMTSFVCLCVLLMFATDALKGGMFLVLANLWNLAANDPSLHAPTLNIGPVILFGFVISVISIFLLAALMRYILRIDVSPLTKFDRSVLLVDGVLPPMTFAQKVALFDLIFYAAWMLSPSIIGTDNALGAFLKSTNFGGSLIAVTLLYMVFKDGKPLFDMQAVHQKFSWKVYIMFAAAVFVGGIMVGKGTNVPQYLSAGMQYLLGGVSPLLLTAIIITLSIVLTNFLNSIALGVLMTPVVLSLALAFNMNAAPLTMCFLFAVLIAGCLPSGSAYAALLFGNTEWVDKKDMIIYNTYGSLVILAVLLIVGIPLANFIF